MKGNLKYSISIWLALLCMASICFGQNKTLKTIAIAIEKSKTKHALQQLSVIKTTDLSPVDLGYYYYLVAESYFCENNDDKAVQNYLLSKEQYIKANATAKAMDINLKIAFIINSFHNDNKKYEYYIEEYMVYAVATRNDAKLLKGYIQIASLKINEKEAQESLLYFRKAIRLNRKVKDKKLESKIYNNISVLFSEVLHQPDSGLVYIKKDLILLQQEKIPNTIYIRVNLMNQSACYSQLRQFDMAIALLNQANNYQPKTIDIETKKNINTFLYMNYKEVRNIEKAFYHLEIANQYHDSVNMDQQNKVVNELDTKYKTKQKELENLQLKNNAKTNRALLLAFILLLFIVIIISILAYKNTIKKKRIAEQDKLIKTQELEKVLKDQELNDIDLILESQEKERQNIANELHDNLGSMLATLKLNFQNLKLQKDILNQQEDHLYKKTDALLDEAYQKVRNIAHLKNLGIIGTEGLLVAVNKMAEKMSVIDKLKINVIPFGLTERLDNTIEVSLFRMIQELCTNIIKHSEATEVNIYLTQGTPTEINIIIEDNGKGFDPKIIQSKSGIGLKNMERKVEQMGGIFTIDSNINIGTSIIIDLPL